MFQIASRSASVAGRMFIFFVMSTEVACRAVAFCEGWETSLNISEPRNSKRLNSFVSRRCRRYPRGITVHSSTEPLLSDVDGLGMTKAAGEAPALQLGRIMRR